MYSDDHLMKEHGFMYPFFWIKYKKYDFFPVCVIIFFLLSSQMGLQKVHIYIIIKLSGRALSPVAP